MRIRWADAALIGLELVALVPDKTRNRFFAWLFPPKEKCEACQRRAKRKTAPRKKATPRKRPPRKRNG